MSDTMTDTMTDTGPNLRRVAALQPWLALLFLVTLLITLGGAIDKAFSHDSNTLGLAVTALFVVQLPGLALVFLSLRAMRNRPALIVATAAMLLPFTGLYALGYVLSEAMRMLSAAGLSPRLFGVPKSLRTALPTESPDSVGVPDGLNLRRVATARRWMFRAIPLIIAGYVAIKYGRRLGLPEEFLEATFWFILGVGVLGVVPHVALCIALRMHPLVTLANALVTVVPFLNLAALIGTGWTASRVLVEAGYDPEAPPSEIEPRSEQPAAASGEGRSSSPKRLILGAAIAVAVIALAGVGLTLGPGLLGERDETPDSVASDTPAPHPDPDPRGQSGDGDPATERDASDEVPGYLSEEVRRQIETDRQAELEARAAGWDWAQATDVPIEVSSTPPRIELFWAQMTAGRGRVIDVGQRVDELLQEHGGFGTWSVNLGVESSWKSFQACIKLGKRYLHTQSPKGSAYFGRSAADKIAPPGPGLTADEQTRWAQLERKTEGIEVIWARFGRANTWLVATDPVREMWRSRGDLVADRSQLGLEDPASRRQKELHVMFFIDGHLFLVRLLRNATFSIEDTPRSAP